MRKAIIFDFDYTLGDSTNGIVISVNDALQQLGYEEKAVDEIRKTIGLSLKDTFYALTSNDDKEMAAQFADLFRKKADEVMVEHTRLYEGVIPILQELKKKEYQIGIVTTKFHYRIEQILAKFQIMELIDIIVGGEDVKVEKPSPEGLLLAISQMKLEKENVLYVGDSLVDAKTAQNANVQFAAVLTGTTSKQDFEPYDYVWIGNSVADIYQELCNS